MCRFEQSLMTYTERRMVERVPVHVIINYRTLLIPINNMQSMDELSQTNTAFKHFRFMRGCVLICILTSHVGVATRFIDITPSVTVHSICVLFCCQKRLCFCGLCVVIHRFLPRVFVPIRRCRLDLLCGSMTCRRTRMARGIHPRYSTATDKGTYDSRRTPENI